MRSPAEKRRHVAASFHGGSRVSSVPERAWIDGAATSRSSASRMPERFCVGYAVASSLALVASWFPARGRKRQQA